MVRGKEHQEGCERDARSLARVKNASRDFVDANRRVMAIGALALGVGVGLLLPEDRVLAPTRQRFEAPMGDAREDRDGESDCQRSHGEERSQKM